MKACAALLMLILLGILGISVVSISQNTGIERGGVTAVPVTAIFDGYFTADTTVIPAGGCVTLAWSKPGASAVVITGSNWPAGTSQPVDLTGSTVACPSAALNYVPNIPVDYTLTAVYPDGTTTAEIITITYSDVFLPATWTPTPAPIMPSSPTFPPPLPNTTPLPVSSSVHFQYFERGFMLQLARQGCVYIFATSPSEAILMPDPGTGYQYCTPAAGLPDNPFPDAPPGLISPTGDFGKVWGYYVGIQDAIGFASAIDFYYDGGVPPMESTLGGGPFYMPVITLPDGRQLYCGSRAATAGTCQLR